MNEKWMKLALEEGEKGRITAPPNPWVGCVIVKNNKLLAKGYHERVGGDHAEVSALKKVSENLKGSSVYVTLEPCTHWGKTPPCVKALIDAQVDSVYIGTQDPDTQVKGKGIALLKNAGIEVHVGILEDEVKKSLEPYLFHRMYGRPFVIAKIAVSLDGKICAEDGSSQWITGPDSLKDVHQLRYHSQGVLIGSGTAIADHPSLTVRTIEEVVQRQPFRVLLDRRGRTPPQGPLFDQELASTLVYTSSEASKAWKESWNAIECTDLSEILEDLGKRGVIQLLIEGGGKIIHSFLQEGYIQKLMIYFGFLALGENGSSWLRGFWPSNISKIPRWDLEEHRVFSDAIRLSIRV